MLKLLTNKREIAKSQNSIVDILKKSLKNNEKLTIGYQGGNFENQVYYNKSLWYSTIILEEEVTVPRYWNAFGLGKRKDGNQIIVVEINPVLEGVTRQVAGLFAKDESTGDIFLLHRGKIGGGRKGIGKEAFENWYRGKWAEVYDENKNKEESILISSINSPNFITKLTLFVQEVAKFKEEVSSGKNTRISSDIEENVTFDPEFHGVKKGNRKSKFEYESNHGLIVNELDKYINHSLKKNQYTFNSSLIDLGIRQNDKVIKIFEVKTSNERQAIYTGIGQLMFHSSGDDGIEKIIVLPDDNFPSKFIAKLANLNITIIRYYFIKKSCKMSGHNNGIEKGGSYENIVGR